MKPILPFKFALKKLGYSKKAVKEIWKWYEFGYLDVYAVPLRVNAFTMMVNL